jgi:REP element-mobilizing transposase RayT
VPVAAAIMQDTLLHFDSQRYKLLGWVIMPNHVHTLIEVLPGYPLSKIVHSWKSYTANMINKALGRAGPLWLPDYFDRFIRNDTHLENALKYIEYNPVRAKLVESPDEWPWGSASWRLHR